MISYERALEHIRALKATLSPEYMPLVDCGGRILAEDLIAKVPSPPFTNSAVDGYAIRHADTHVGKTYEVSGTIYARPVDPQQLPAHRPGSVVRVMTGGYLPSWADAVIPVENATLIDHDHVQFSELPEAGTNLRREGEDLAAGTLVLKKGAQLDPERIMLAAAFGYRSLAVVERPHLEFLSTGDELTEPGEPLPPGGVYNSSKYFLLTAARALGFDAPHRTLADNEAEATKTIAALLETKKSTLIITTGAVSAGELDFLPKIGANLGFKALFHKVAIRPGKPIYLAVKDQVVWLGLPGNPISSCVGWHAFARPLLSVMAGLPPPEKRMLVLKNEVRKPENLRCFFRAEVSGDKAWVAQRQGSAHFAASVTNEAYVELPEGFSRIPAETRVEAIIV